MKHFYEVRVDFSEWVALFDGEEALLGVVMGDGDDEFIEKAGCALEYVEVAVGDGIKASWIDGAAHGYGMVAGRNAGCKALAAREPA